MAKSQCGLRSTYNNLAVLTQRDPKEELKMDLNLEGGKKYTARALNVSSSGLRSLPGTPLNFTSALVRNETIAFEDVFERVQGYGSVAQRPLPQTIKDVLFFRKDHEPLINYSGGYSNGDLGANDSFPTDYAGLWAFGDGVRIRFPDAISELSFKTRGCACESQGVFEVIVNGTVVQEFGVTGRSEELKVTVLFETPIQDVILRSKSGSSSIVLIDDLEWFIQDDPLIQDDMLVSEITQHVGLVADASLPLTNNSYGALFVDGEAVYQLAGYYEDMTSNVKELLSKGRSPICVMTTNPGWNYESEGFRAGKKISLGSNSSEFARIERPTTGEPARTTIFHSSPSLDELGPESAVMCWKNATSPENVTYGDFKKSFGGKVRLVPFASSSINFPGWLVPLDKIVSSAPDRILSPETSQSFHWILGLNGNNCQVTCSNIGKTFDEATINFAGNAGTDANCSEAFGKTNGDLSEIMPISGNASGLGARLGCHVNQNGQLYRATYGETDSESSNDGARRICGCR